MKKQLFLLSVALAAFLPIKDCQKESIIHDGPIALVNGFLIDGTGASPVPDSVVVIRDNLIAAVGDQDGTDMPEDAEIIDLRGATILPGFINAHVHGAYNENNLRAWALDGVTAVRDLGGNPNDDLFAFRDRMLEKPSCARLVAAGPMVTVPGGYPMVPWGSSGFPVTSTVDARFKAGQLLDQGADIIKIALESGGSFNLTIPMLSPAEAAAITEVAHQRGTVVSAHVLVSNDLEHALNAGVDDVAHMVTDNLSDDLISRMIDDDVYWVPTLELWHGVGHGLLEVAIDNLRRFVEAGGKVALGTDYGGYNSPFDLGMPIREIRWMQASGMTTQLIIVSATKNAAHVCNLEDRIGTLEIGKRADLLIVFGNPLEDIEALQEIRMVIRDGKIIRENNHFL